MFDRIEFVLQRVTDDGSTWRGHIDVDAYGAITSADGKRGAVHTRHLVGEGTFHDVINLAAAFLAQHFDRM